MNNLMFTDSFEPPVYTLYDLKVGDNFIFSKDADSPDYYCTVISDTAYLFLDSDGSSVVDHKFMSLTKLKVERVFVKHIISFR